MKKPFNEDTFKSPQTGLIVLQFLSDLFHVFGIRGTMSGLLLKQELLTNRTFSLIVNESTRSYDMPSL